MIQFIQDQSLNIEEKIDEVNTQIYQIEQNQITIYNLNIYYLFSQGQQLLFQGNFEKANFYFDQALIMDPNHFKSLCQKGQTLMYLKQLQEALKLFNSVLSQQPNNQKVLYLKYQCLLKQDQKDKANQFSQHQLKVMSKEFKHFSKAGLNFFTLNQANLFMLNGQMKQQKYTLKCSNIIFLQSININGIEEFDEAINCADIILNINTQHYQSFAQKAQSLMKLGKFNEAIIQIEKALSIKQKDQKLIIIKGKKYFKGIILKQICNFHAAIKWLTLADNDQQSKTLIEKLQTLTMMMSNIKQLFNLQNNFQLKSFTLLSNWLLSM